MRRKAMPLRPESHRSNYITAEGAERLRDELKFLWQHERPKVTQAVSDAAALGDRSENAEYIYGKKRLREIDGRLHWLKKRLEAITIVTPSQEREGTVYFGAWVRLLSATGREVTYRIVGPDEINLDRGMISMDSPLGLALMRHVVGDDVIVKRPLGDLSYRILAAQYVPFDDETIDRDSSDEALVGAVDIDDDDDDDDADGDFDDVEPDADQLEDDA